MRGMAHEKYLSNFPSVATEFVYGRHVAPDNVALDRNREEQRHSVLAPEISPFPSTPAPVQPTSTIRVCSHLESMARCILVS